jgi:formylglycine-generating enzyme required for sulfatase activity
MKLNPMLMLVACGCLGLISYQGDAVGNSGNGLEESRSTESAFTVGGLEMRRIPGGTFTMGSNDSKARADERSPGNTRELERCSGLL